MRSLVQQKLCMIQEQVSNMQSNESGHCVEMYQWSTLKVARM
jgi:hypothetical protein